MSAHESPLVSVIIPVFNGEKYVAQTIDSIKAQSWQNIEIVAVDDGSTDGTAEILKADAAVKYIHQNNGGVGVALNTGVEHSSGAFIAGLDADDLWHPLKIELQMKVLSDSPDIDMVFSFVEQFISPELDEAAKSNIQCPEGSAPGISICTILARRETFLQVGTFRDNLQVGQFLDWYLRAKEAGLKDQMLPQALLRRRLHKSNMGFVKKDARSDYARIIKASLDRKRKAAKDDNA